MRFRRVVVLIAVVAGVVGCAAPAGWHYEQVWTVQPDPTDHKPSWLAGRFLTCQVRDRTYEMRRCL